MPHALPRPFRDLESLTDEWLMKSESERMNKRFSSSFDELRAFYDRLAPRLEEILKYLHQRELVSLNEEDRNLLDLTLSLADVSIAVDKVGAVRNPDTYDPYRFEFLHEDELNHMRPTA